MSKDSVQIHPLAMQFPALPASEMKELKTDIAANGIRVPLLFTKDGKVLIDGRNRWYAAYDLGLKPEQIPTERFKGKDEDIPSVILSRNLYRRHLTDKQRAALVTKFLAPQLEKEASARKKAGGSFKGGASNGETVGRTSEKIAKAAKTGRHTAEQALKVHKAEGDAGLDRIIHGKDDLAKAAASVPKKTRTRAPKVQSFADAVWTRWSAFLKNYSPTERRQVKELIIEWLAKEAGTEVKATA